MKKTFNKEITSPVLEQGQGYIFHAGGADFKITGNHIELVSETNDVFKALVVANELFDINESGISFYYDWNSKSRVTKVQEGAEANFAKYITLSEKLDFLESTTKELRLSYGAGSKHNALTEANKELTATKKALNETKASSLVVKFSYDANEKIFKAGNIEQVIGTELPLSEVFFSAAYIRYEDKKLIDTFQLASQNFESYKVLDFVAESKADQVTIVTMRAEKNAFVFRTNEDTKISKFEKMLADAAITYTANETGVDVTEQFQDLLESAAIETSNKLKEADLYKEMLSFLYDQKGRLAEADRNLPDIKAADHLISSEITRIGGVIEALEEDTLGIEDGYVSAKLKAEAEGLAEETELKVDSIEYNQAGKNDILTVFVENTPYRIEKYKINISEDNI